jgi:hypothetical protein
MRALTRILVPLALVLTLPMPPGPAAAAPAVSERFEALFEQVNDCKGERLDLEVTYHGVFKPQRDGTYLFHVTIRGQGRGSQGNDYVLQLNSHERLTTIDYSFVERVRLISKGSAPNQLVVFQYDEDSGYTLEMDCTG